MLCNAFAKLKSLEPGFWYTIIRYLSLDVNDFTAFFKPQGFALVLNALARKADEFEAWNRKETTEVHKVQELNRLSSYQKLHLSAGLRAKFEYAALIFAAQSVADNQSCLPLTLGQFCMIANGFARLSLDKSIFAQLPLLHHLRLAMAEIKECGTGSSESGKS